jgi:protein disulfide-isomerase-like protein
MTFVDTAKQFVQEKKCICISGGILVILLAVVAFFLYKKYNKPAAIANIFPDVTESFDTPPQQDVAASAKTLALFYAPWCGHCKKIMPIWDKLDETHRSNGLGEITVVKINCDEQQDIAKKHSVGGFPTIKLLPQGLNVPDQAVEYKGDRSYDSIIEFLSSNK